MSRYPIYFLFFTNFKYFFIEKLVIRGKNGKNLKNINKIAIFLIFDKDPEVRRGRKLGLSLCQDGGVLHNMNNWTNILRVDYTYA